MAGPAGHWRDRGIGDDADPWLVERQGQAGAELAAGLVELARGLQERAPRGAARAPRWLAGGGGLVTPADAYGERRPLMCSIAYRMTGSVSDAEDIVQEAFLRYHRAQERGQETAAGAIESPKAYLSAVTTRLCIDQLRSARS